jgi:DNA-binding GntR family transcriptional regulator
LGKKFRSRFSRENRNERSCLIPRFCVDKYICWGTVYTHMKKLVIKESKTIRRKVYDFLREQLLSGEIPPHERLIETKIAQEVGISRTPVREALHNLEMEGLIEAIPRVGYVVKPISKDEIEEICQIRTINECLAARWAMQRITPKELQALEKNLSVSEAEVKKGNPRSFVELDAEFHEIVARASGSERLLELCQTLRRHMLRYRIALRKRTRRASSRRSRIIWRRLKKTSCATHSGRVSKRLPALRAHNE